jgi:linoleoyl-CoA desaturase
MSQFMHTDDALNSVAPGASFQSDDQRLASFGRALDGVRSDVEAQLGDADRVHIQRIGRWSAALEIAGRGLIHFSLEPVGFIVGVAALSAHKSLELMEIGHMALHGCYENLEGAEHYHPKRFRWKAPIDEVSWRNGHNIRHHQYTNIEGRDPDLDFGVLRLSSRVPYRRLHALQPITNLLSGLGFATAINLHVTGMLDVYSGRKKANMLRDLDPETIRAQRRTFTSKLLRYYQREYVFFPLLAGPFFLKTLLGNVLSEVIRDVHSASIVYCGHVGAKDYVRGTRAKGRPQWYKMQAEAARNVRVCPPVSVLCGALDRQIEHHLFPRMPPNRLREIAPRVKAICEAHDVQYLEASWSSTLRDVLHELRRVSARDAAIANLCPTSA